MRQCTIAAVVALAAAQACAGLQNGDFETNTSAPFGSIDHWGPNGGWADHASFARPGNESLGLYFGFYSAGTTETVGQLTDITFQAGHTYTFKSWATGGGNDIGVVSYQIGYDDGSGNFTELATATYDLTGLGSWVETEGVTWTVAVAGTPEIGKNIWVRFGDANSGSSDDIWFDNASLVPAPTPVALLACAGFLRRRHR